jgi:Flp pilus assembly protein TadD
MKRYTIPCVAIAASLSLSCVRQVRTAADYSAPTQATKSASPKPVPVPAMERQIRNAKDAGDGDYYLAELRRKVAAEPDNVDVRLDLIEHYTREGYPDVALEHCRLAAVKFPDSADVQLRMAKLLRTMKLDREAEKGLSAFLETHPQKSPEYESWLGILRDELGNWSAGEQAHRAAIAQGANIDYLHNNLGYNLLLQGQPAEAAQEFRVALKIQPDSQYAQNNLAMAAAALQKEAALSPPAGDPATAHSNMAALLIEQKRYAEARRELDLALGYNKDHAEALKNLRLVSELDGKPAVIPLKPVQSKWSRFKSKISKLADIVGG